MVIFKSRLRLGFFFHCYSLSHILLPRIFLSFARSSTLVYLKLSSSPHFLIMLVIVLYTIYKLRRSRNIFALVWSYSIQSSLTSNLMSSLVRNFLSFPPRFSLVIKNFLRNFSPFETFIAFTIVQLKWKSQVMDWFFSSGKG